MKNLHRVLFALAWCFLGFSQAWAYENKSWGNQLGAKSKRIGNMELVYWDNESNANYASDVLKWFSQLPYYKKAFENGKIIIAPSKAEGGIHLVLEKMAGQNVHPGYKEAEGTSKEKGKWPPPFHEFPFVIISSESIGQSNVGLIHELLHHYYSAIPQVVVSQIEKVHDIFFASSGVEFKFKNDPGHIYVWGCQYFPIGYQSIIYEQFPRVANICKLTLGLNVISQRGTLESGVRLWAVNFVKNNGINR